MSSATRGGARIGEPLRSGATIWDAPTAPVAVAAPSGVRPSSLLLVDDGEATTNVTLFAGTSALRLVGGMTIPRGGSAEAVGELLAATNLGSREFDAARPRVIYHGGAADLPRAALRIATALELPIVLFDIGATAGRFAAASPSRPGPSIELEAAALSPSQAVERRRRADFVIASIGASSRALVADQLGDLCDAPLRDRSPEGDRTRTAAVAGAIARLGEELRSGGFSIEQGSIIVVTGFAARLIADGVLPLASLTPLLPIGRSRVLLDPFATAGALGSMDLPEEYAAELIRDPRGDLLLPGGDLLCIDGGGVEVSVDGRVTPLNDDAASHLSLAIGEVARIEIRRGGVSGEALLSGGVGGAAIVVGSPSLRVALHPAPSGSTRIDPIPAPIALLPEAQGGNDLIAARRLLGDEVAGRVVALSADPDSRGWEAARDAGILAVAKASPETVLRARAVGVRGLIVGSLSDGEIEALSGSLDRRIAAAVATLPFGLLVLAARSGSGDGAARLIERLDGAEVTFSSEPPGLVARGRVVRDASDAPRGADVAIVGGQHVGRRGYWRGIADLRPGDPIAAIELDGVIFGLPLGDAQRLDA
ncbi:MAG: hypothetical protein ACR2JL_03620 [Candidatus Limnocylindrus sp.]